MRVALWQYDENVAKLENGLLIIDTKDEAYAGLTEELVFLTGLTNYPAMAAGPTYSMHINFIAGEPNWVLEALIEELISPAAYFTIAGENPEYKISLNETASDNTDVFVDLGTVIVPATTFETEIQLDANAPFIAIVQDEVDGSYSMIVYAKEAV